MVAQSSPISNSGAGSSWSGALRSGYSRNSEVELGKVARVEEGDGVVNGGYLVELGGYLER